MKLRIRLAVLAALALVLAAGCGEEFEPTSLKIVPKGDLTVGETAQLEVIGIDDEGREEAITEGLSFKSSNEGVATVDENGLVTVHARAAVTLTATADLGESGTLEATFETTPICHYPAHDMALSDGKVVPPLRWQAKDANGMPFEFKMEDVYCNLEWRGVNTLHLVFSAGWCGPCTEYARYLSPLSGTLAQKGMRILTVEMDTMFRGQDADTNFAFDHLKKIATPVSGFSAGLRNTYLAGHEKNFRDVLRQFVTIYPTRLIVRTADMRVIADGSVDGPWRQTTFPLEDIAANPNANWSQPGAGGTPQPIEE